MIKIFACDHRHNIDWNLPYIRFGGVESDCQIKVDNIIENIPVNADETPKIYWLWKNLATFKDIKYIGYCQYRRFFTNLNVKKPILNITYQQFNSKFAMTPDQQAKLLECTNYDGILHPSFKVVNDKLHPHEYIWEELAILENDNMLPYNFQKLAFELLLENTPEHLKNYMKQAFKCKDNYLCNIFTVKIDIFQLFGNIAFKSVVDLLNLLTQSEKQNLHPYWLAYVFERYTSCFYHSLELSKKYKFIKRPLITIDAHKHIKWNRK